MRNMTEFSIYQTPEYSTWFNEETFRSQSQILDRLDKIKEEGYFGNHKYLEDSIWELKFNDGRRIYYVYFKEKQVLLLLGGNKNGQNKDITKAKNIYRKRKVDA